MPWLGARYVPRFGKTATVAGVALGVVGTLAVGEFAHIEPVANDVAADASQVNEGISEIDQLAMEEGEHDRLIGWNPASVTEPEAVQHRGEFASQIYLFASANLTLTALPSDVMLTGDWDGDGDETTGVLRTVEFGPLSASEAVFLATDGEGGLEQPRIFFDMADGLSPLVGDWDGNGSDSLAIRRSAAHDPFAQDVVEFYDSEGKEMSQPLEVNRDGIIVVGDAEVATRLVRLRGGG